MRPVQEEPGVDTGEAQHDGLQGTQLQPHRRRNTFILTHLVEHQPHHLLAQLPRDLSVPCAGKYRFVVRIGYDKES